MDPFPMWTRDDDKRFESALTQFPNDSPTRLEKISQHLQKPYEEVKYYHDALVHDVALIESDNVPLTESSSRDKRKREIIHWTKDEHRLFLDGLQKYGKGDWVGISRYCVKTRTPTQLSNHYQRFLERQNKDSQEKKRNTILDNTLATDGTNVNLDYISNWKPTSQQQEGNNAGSNLDLMGYEQPEVDQNPAEDDH